MFGVSGLISFRMDWLELLAVQGTLKSLLQHHSSKASILQHSAFFIVQLSHQCMTLSGLVIVFLPRNKRLNFMAAVTMCNDFGAQKFNSATVSTVFPSICYDVMGLDTMILVSEC